MAYLILANGRIFEGQRIGSKKDALGELVFATPVEGYIETLTDPSYFGQIVIQTFPLIGNYGFISEDKEGKSELFGYIVRELCDTPSNYRCENNLEQYLIENDIPGLQGLDTRELTLILRDEGTMNALICDEIPDDLSFIKEYQVVNAVKSVSTNRMYSLKGENSKYKVALIDFGAKANIIRSLLKRGCDLDIYPYNVDSKTLLDGNYDGIMLSNGPGDPKENVDSIRTIKEVIGKIPLFGICLGHQLTALALGGDTQKLKFGHRGGNQPAKNLLTGRTYITSQNHGYAAIKDSLFGIGEEYFVNVNDGSNEGMIYKDKKAFTVQFHPEACSGPKDSDFLFDEFLKLMGKEKSHA